MPSRKKILLGNQGTREPGNQGTRNFTNYSQDMYFGFRHVGSGVKKRKTEATLAKRKFWFPSSPKSKIHFFKIVYEMPGSLVPWFPSWIFHTRDFLSLGVFCSTHFLLRSTSRQAATTPCPGLGCGQAGAGAQPRPALPWSLFGAAQTMLCTPGAFLGLESETRSF